MLPGTSHKTCLLLHPSLPWRRVMSYPMARSSVLARTNSAAPRCSSSLPFWAWNMTASMNLPSNPSLSVMSMSVKVSVPTQCPLVVPPCTQALMTTGSSNSPGILHLGLIFQQVQFTKEGQGNTALPLCTANDSRWSSRSCVTPFLNKTCRTGTTLFFLSIINIQKNFSWCLDSGFKNWNGDCDSNCFTMCLRTLILFIFVAAAIGSSLSSPKQPNTLIQKGGRPSSFRVHAREASSIRSV